MTVTAEKYHSDWARNLVAEGKARGKAEGKAEGEAEGKAEGEAEGKAEGEARGKAEALSRAILLVLEANGVVVSEVASQTIRNCTDIDQLTTWLLRAVKATPGEDVLGA